MYFLSLARIIQWHGPWRVGSKKLSFDENMAIMFRNITYKEIDNVVKQ